MTAKLLPDIPPLRSRSAHQYHCLVPLLRTGAALVIIILPSNIFHSLRTPHFRQVLDCRPLSSAATPKSCGIKRRQPTSCSLTMVPIQQVSTPFENSGRDSATFKDRQLFIGKYTLPLFTGGGFAGDIETIQPQIYNYNNTAAPNARPNPNSDDNWRSG
jgi:hypothetical protein